MNYNYCLFPCSPADEDEQGRCKCQREAASFPREPVESLLKKMKLYRKQFREQLQDEMNRQNFKFIPLLDGLCSLDAAISKFENFHNEHH